MSTSISRSWCVGWGIALLSFAGAGCGIAHPHGVGSGEPIPPISTPVFELQGNTATGVSAGVQAGYGVRTLGGKTFRVIWTGDGATGGGYHEFWGTAWTTGTFSDEVLGCTNGFCQLEGDDFVSAPYASAGGQRIDWDTFANDALDGFEVTTDTLPLYFDVVIDGQRYPNLVFFPDAQNGGQIDSVTAIPFAMTTNDQNN